MNRDPLVEQLIEHEGLRLRPYVDTVGKLTIGVGRNLTDKGISRATALQMLDEDIDEAVADCASFAWFARMDGVRQRALVDLRFNLGPTRFRGFRKMLAALERDDYATAAGQLRNSKWYRQVKRRGPRIVHMLATGTEA